MANILLAARGTSSVSVGRNWVTKLVKRRPEIVAKFARKYDYKRAKCEDRAKTESWFSYLQSTVEQYGILPEDIYNFDETGFATGLIATAKVITRSEMAGKPNLVQPGNREWVTAIECIGTRGVVLPSCIIFKAKVHIGAWYQEPMLPRDWRIKVSENGWTTDEIGLRWLQNIFIPYATKYRLGRCSLLVLDGHGSHLTPQFDKACMDNNIIPICMPPHSSHLLQPLDLSCFAPLKRAYGSFIEQQARLGHAHVDKMDFLEAYCTSHSTTFKESTIQSGFKAAGIHPFAPDEVYSKLTTTLRTPSPMASHHSTSLPSSAIATPHNIRSLKKKASSITKLLEQGLFVPKTPSKRAVRQLVKGCELAMQSSVLLTQEVEELRKSQWKENAKVCQISA